MQAKIKQAIGASKQGALANMIVFPIFMLVGYVLLIIYFQLRGGYQQIHLDEGHPPPA